MAYTKTDWRNGETPLSANNFNHMEDGIEAAHERADGCYLKTEADAKFRTKSDSYNRREVINAIYPVGSIYMSVNNVNPGILFGGTWEAWGAGKVPVGVNANDTSFNTVEKTGGSKDAIVPLHNHLATFEGVDVPAHTHSGPTHTHTVPAHSHVEPIIANGLSVSHKKAASGSENVVSDVDLNYSVGETRLSDVLTTGAAGTGSTGAAGGHKPAGTVRVDATGNVATNANLQPYITCYMWKRTAL